jgi:hypothetical protein
LTNDNDWEKTGDDMYSSPSGNVGLGTVSPQEKLHVEGSIRMVDGNQAAGYVMTSDADGTATWTNPDSIQTASTGLGGYTMQWGGELKSDSYAKYGGKPGEGKQEYSSYKTKGVVPVSGNITKYSWSSEHANSNSVIDIIINGTSHNYLSLTGDIGVLTISPSITVSEGDVIEIKGTDTDDPGHDDDPGKTGMTLFIE